MTGGINATYIQGYSNSIIGIINGILVPTLISIAFLVFLWGIYKYFIKGAVDPKERESGRVFALYGVIGFVILFSIWGIVQIFMGTLGLTATNVPAFPTIGPGTGASGGSSSYFPGAGGTSYIQQPSAGYSGTSGTMSATQSAAYSSLQQQYSACQSSGNPNSQACTTYSQNLAAYNAQYSSSQSSMSGTAAAGAACTDNSSCQNGLTCDLNASPSVCISIPSDSAGQGDRCASDSSCQTGLYCDTTYTCVPNTDNSSASSGSGDLVCGANSTISADGNSCECDSGYNYDSNGDCVTVTDCSQYGAGYTEDANGDCVSNSSQDSTNEASCASEGGSYDANTDTCLGPSE